MGSLEGGRPIYFRDSSDGTAQAKELGKYFHAQIVGVVSSAEDGFGLPDKIRTAHLQPRNWHESVLEKRIGGSSSAGSTTTSKLRDRRLSVSLIADWENGFKGWKITPDDDDHKGHAFLDDWAGEQKSTRVVDYGDPRGHTALLSQLVKVVDTADGQYGLALVLGRTLTAKDGSTAAGGYVWDQSSEATGGTTSSGGAATGRLGLLDTLVHVRSADQVGAGRDGTLVCKLGILTTALFHDMANAQSGPMLSFAGKTLPTIAADGATAYEVFQGYDAAKSGFRLFVKPGSSGSFNGAGLPPSFLAIDGNVTLDGTTATFLYMGAYNAGGGASKHAISQTKDISYHYNQSPKCYITGTETGGVGRDLYIDTLTFPDASTILILQNCTLYCNKIVGPGTISVSSTDLYLREADPGGSQYNEVDSTAGTGGHGGGHQPGSGFVSQSLGSSVPITPFASVGGAAAYCGNGGNGGAGPGTAGAAGAPGGVYQFAVPMGLIRSNTDPFSSVFGGCGGGQGYEGDQFGGGFGGAGGGVARIVCTDMSGFNGKINCKGANGYNGLGTAQAGGGGGGGVSIVVTKTQVQTWTVDVSPGTGAHNGTAGADLLFNK